MSDVPRLVGAIMVAGLWTIVLGGGVAEQVQELRKRGHPAPVLAQAVPLALTVGVLDALLVRGTNQWVAFGASMATGMASFRLLRGGSW